MWKPASAADDSSIIDMSLELFREDPGPKPVPADHTRRTLAKFRAEPARGCAFVLHLAGKAEGYALLASFWSNELGGEICTVDEFFVRADLRSQGHGRRLLEELIAKGPLWPRSAVALDLEVTPDNQRARRFYISLGFKPAKNTHMRLRFE